MSRRAYLATDRPALRALSDVGQLAAGSYAVVEAASTDEQDEYDAMVEAGELAEQRWGEALVVAVEAAAVTPPGDVDRADVASLHVGEDLAWYATQELETLLAEE
ncbi:hypothetical protein CLV56_2805 [Mumia flava]|uniref:Uncharacterized protein n=1 Tax=Mumia flava TaxID=1348852 RepID=A0A0B2BI83_9ACTN|nr:hypothetical protein [Mumia flava]PJJ58554.1 hypothetical protein CLV56_2805 [Mumia flava]